MYLRLATAALLSAVFIAPTVAADWTGFYSGIYAGVSVRSDAANKLVGALGEFDPDGSQDPDTFINHDNAIDPDLFDLLVGGRNLFNTVPSGEAIGYVLDADLTFAPAPALGAVTGYSFGNGVRVEAEMSMAQFRPVGLDIHDILMQRVSGQDSAAFEWTWALDDEDTDPGASFDLGDASTAAAAAFLLANVWYDFDNDTAFTPYLGGGVGLAMVRNLLILPFGSSDSSSSLSLAGQVGGGVLVDLNETSFLDLGYRLKATAGGSTSVTAFNKQDDLWVGLNLQQGGPIMVHTLQAGLNIRY